VVKCAGTRRPSGTSQLCESESKTLERASQKPASISSFVLYFFFCFLGLPLPDAADTYAGVDTSDLPPGLLEASVSRDGYGNDFDVSKGLYKRSLLCSAVAVRAAVASCMYRGMGLVGPFTPVRFLLFRISAD